MIDHPLQSELHLCLHRHLWSPGLCLAASRALLRLLIKQQAPQPLEAQLHLLQGQQQPNMKVISFTRTRRSSVVKALSSRRSINAAPSSRLRLTSSGRCIAGYTIPIDHT